MNPPFNRPAVEKPTFLARLFGRKHKSEALVLLWDYLNRDYPEFRNFAAAVEDIKAKTKIDVQSATATDLEDWFSRYVKFFLADSRLSEDENRALTAIQAGFGISNRRREEIVNDQIGSIYKTTIQGVLADGVVTDEEIQRIARISSSLGISSEFDQKIKGATVKPFIEGKLTAAVANKTLSPQDDAELKTLAGRLGCNLVFDGDTERTLNKYRLLWKIQYGDLEAVDAGISLQKNEQCYWFSEVALHEMRRVTVRRSYSGPAFRIKIVKGVYWKSGSYSVASQTQDQLQRIDSGTLYITNKRVIFSGAFKNLTIRLNKILDFDAYSDGMKLDKDTGKDPYFLFPGGTEVACAILGRLILEGAE